MCCHPDYGVACGVDKPSGTFIFCDMCFIRTLLYTTKAWQEMLGRPDPAGGGDDQAVAARAQETLVQELALEPAWFQGPRKAQDHVVVYGAAVSAVARRHGLWDPRAPPPADSEYALFEWLLAQGEKRGHVQSEAFVMRLNPSNEDAARVAARGDGPPAGRDAAPPAAPCHLFQGPAMTPAVGAVVKSLVRPTSPPPGPSQPTPPPPGRSTPGRWIPGTPSTPAQMVGSPSPQPQPRPQPRPSIGSPEWNRRLEANLEAEAVGLPLPFPPKRPFQYPPPTPQPATPAKAEFGSNEWHRRVEANLAAEAEGRPLPYEPRC